MYIAPDYIPSSNRPDIELEILSTEVLDAIVAVYTDFNDRRYASISRMFDIDQVKPLYDETKTYYEGEIVTFTPKRPFKEEDWTKIDPKEYVEGESYTKGEYVVQGGEIYRCKEDCNPETSEDFVKYFEEVNYSDYNANKPYSLHDVVEHYDGSSNALYEYKEDNWTKINPVPYDDKEHYYVWDYVDKLGDIYRCIHDYDPNTAADFDRYFIKIDPSKYEADKPYSVRDVVKYDVTSYEEELYECTKTIPITRGPMYLCINPNEEGTTSDPTDTSSWEQIEYHDYIKKIYQLAMLARYPGYTAVDINTFYGNINALEDTDRNYTLDQKIGAIRNLIDIVHEMTTNSATFLGVGNYEPNQNYNMKDLFYFEGGLYEVLSPFNRGNETPPVDKIKKISVGQAMVDAEYAHDFYNELFTPLDDSENQVIQGVVYQYKGALYRATANKTKAKKESWDDYMSYLLKPIELSDVLNYIDNAGYMMYLDRQTPLDMVDDSKFIRGSVVKANRSYTPVDPSWFGTGEVVEEGSVWIKSRVYRNASASKPVWICIYPSQPGGMKWIGKTPATDAIYNAGDYSSGTAFKIPINYILSEPEKKYFGDIDIVGKDTCWVKVRDPDDPACDKDHPVYDLISAADDNALKVMRKFKIDPSLEKEFIFNELPYNGLIKIDKAKLDGQLFIDINSFTGSFNAMRGFNIETDPASLDEKWFGTGVVPKQNSIWRKVRDYDNIETSGSNPMFELFIEMPDAFSLKKCPGDEITINTADYPLDTLVKITSDVPDGIDPAYFGSDPEHEPKAGTYWLKDRDISSASGDNPVYSYVMGAPDIEGNYVGVKRDDVKMYVEKWSDGFTHLLATENYWN